jgi:hypothetical protein
MPDGTVFAPGVESLQDDQQSVTSISVQQMLEALQAFQRFFESFIIAPLSESFIGVAIL